MKTNYQKTPAQPRKPLNPYHANNQVEIMATITTDCDDYRTEHSDGSISTQLFHYGFENPKRWDPSTQSWKPLPDIFHVSAVSMELARKEFWSRLNTYMIKRWGHRVIVTTTN